MRYFSGDDVDVFVCGEPREWDAVEYARDSIAAGKKKGLIVLGHDMSEEKRDGRVRPLAERLHSRSSDRVHALR